LPLSSLYPSLKRLALRLTADPRPWFLPARTRWRRAGGFFATRLEARPEHLGSSGERNHHGQNRDRKEYLCHSSLDPICSSYAGLDARCFNRAETSRQFELR